jgi:uncharacterized damage-inducible protein DinB
MRELNLKYPVGEFVLPQSLTPQQRIIALQQVNDFPSQLQLALAGLTADQIDNAVRPGAWSIRRLVHHICDSHLVAYSWMRLALTEEWPLVFAYDPDRMSQLADCSLHPSISLQLLGALHERWVAMLTPLTDDEWQARGYTHPETGRCSLEQALAMYAWHSIHHLAQIRQCVVANGVE